MQQYDAHVEAWHEWRVMEAERQLYRRQERIENAYYENEYYWRY